MVEGRHAGVLDLEPSTVYELDKTGVGGEAVRQGKPIIINDFAAPNALKKGYPEGHSPLARFLTVPVRSAGRIVAVVAVANKQTDYEAVDVAQLTLLMDSVWKIVERRRAQHALVREKAFVDSLVDTAQTVILVLDPKGRIVRFNRYLEELSGYRLDDVRGRDWFDTFLPDRVRQGARALFRSALPGVRTTGNINPIVTADGKERLLERYDSALTLSGSRRIKDIARGLGTFSRIETEKVAPVDLRYPIESALNIAFNEIKYRAQIVKDFCTRVPVLANEGRLAQVFLNLFINATHAMTEGDVESNKLTVRTWQEGDATNLRKMVAAWVIESQAKR